MTAEERIIRNALDEARRHGASYGAGGKVAARIYHAEMLTPEEMLYMIAVMTNGLAALEAQVSA